MIAKLKAIRLSYPHLVAADPPWVHKERQPATCCYRVEEIKDSTDYPPGSHLQKAEVDKLCASGAWRVVIVLNT